MRIAVKLTTMIVSFGGGTSKSLGRAQVFTEVPHDKTYKHIYLTGSWIYLVNIYPDNSSDQLQEGIVWTLYYN